MKGFLRFAEQGDAEAILDIYAPYIRGTAVTFEESVPSIEEFRERICRIQEECPYLVYQMGNEIAGYAYANRNKARPAYRWNAELSVYIADAYIGRRLGRALYGALIEICTLQGLKNLYGIVTVPNPGSEALHEAMGFERVGLHRKTGYRMGKWRDLAWFEKKIGVMEESPQDFIPIDKIPQERLEEILQRYSQQNQK